MKASRATLYYTGLYGVDFIAIRTSQQLLSRSPFLCRCKFLTEGSTPRRGRRVLPVTLGRHHKPFESAGTARGLSALDLVGALHALWRAERRGAREKGVDQDGRTIRDWHHQRVQSRQRGLEWVRVLRNVSRAAREGTCPTCTGY